MKPTTLAHCLDILDWFDDPLYEYIHHILIAKLDGEARIHRAFPHLADHAGQLIAAHIGTEIAYPDVLWNQPA